MSDPIVRVAARGDGVTADGRYAAYAAPGDMLTAAGDVVPGPHHRTPPCRHFPACGGCRLQHLDDRSYAGFVTDRIASALDAQDLSAPIRPAIVSPPRTRRRATLHAEAKGGKVRIGFAEAKSHAIVDMEECWVLSPELFARVAPLRRLLGRLGLRRRGDVHLTIVDQGIDILVTGLAAEGLDNAERIIAFCQEHRIARFAVDAGMGPESRWEPEPVTVTLGGVPVAFPPAAFLQATREGEAALIDAVRQGVGTAGTVADLFAGLGTFALALDARVYAAEGARDAISTLRSAANMHRRAVFAEHRDLYRRPLTTVELDRFDAIVLDPPRSGAREQVGALAATTARTIVYVSCDPGSFARDAKILCAGGWRIDEVQGVGQFLWSTHVELVARFSRPDS